LPNKPNPALFTRTRSQWPPARCRRTTHAPRLDETDRRGKRAPCERSSAQFRRSRSEASQQFVPRVRRRSHPPLRREPTPARFLWKPRYEYHRHFVFDSGTVRCDCGVLSTLSHSVSAGLAGARWEAAQRIVLAPPALSAPTWPSCSTGHLRSATPPADPDSDPRRRPSCRNHVVRSGIRAAQPECPP